MSKAFATHVPSWVRIPRSRVKLYLLVCACNSSSKMGNRDRRFSESLPICLGVHNSEQQTLSWGKCWWQILEGVPCPLSPCNPHSHMHKHTRLKLWFCKTTSFRAGCVSSFVFLMSCIQNPRKESDTSRKQTGTSTLYVCICVYVCVCSSSPVVREVGCCKDTCGKTTNRTQAIPCLIIALFVFVHHPSAFSSTICPSTVCLLIVHSSNSFWYISHSSI